MITVLTLLSLFGLHIISRIQLLYRSSETYVFCGLNEYAYHLIRSLRENGRDRCIIVIEGETEQRGGRGSGEENHENQCILIDRNAGEVENLRRLKLPARFYQKPFISSCYLSRKMPIFKQPSN